MRVLSQSCSSPINNISEQISCNSIVFNQLEVRQQENFKIPINGNILVILCSMYSIVLFFHMKSKHITFSILFLLTLLQVNGAISFQRQQEIDGCLEYMVNKCVKCHQDYHLHNNKCQRNIVGCIRYQEKEPNCYACAQCEYGYTINKHSRICLPTMFGQQLNTTRILQQNSPITCNTISNTSRQCQDLKKNQYFKLVDRYMLNGNYKHFISQSSAYIKSVGLYYKNSDANFKIIYYSSGRGLMLCLISINMATKAIQLKSFVAIGTDNLVDQCRDYGEDANCSECETGYHLSSGKCYRSIQNCLRHFRNICIQCSQYSLLIENRCITTCKQILDLNKIRLYGDVRAYQSNLLPTVEQSYLLNI